MRKIGIFGGAFDPVHIGHTEVAEIALHELELDIIYILPTASPPHKATHAADSHRLKMTLDAFDQAKMTVSDYEFHAPSPSYTSRTLSRFKDQFPSDKLYFIMGGDMLESFPKWDSPKKITELATLVAVKRKGSASIKASAQKIADLFGTEVVVLKDTPRTVSSSRVRVDILFGLPTPDLRSITQKYIATEGLYRKYGYIVDKLKSNLSEARFMHTYYTVLKGIELAKVLKIEEDKALLACLLHDCAKEIPCGDYSRYGFSCDNLHPSICHAFLGAIVAEVDYGIKNPEILNAIRYHSTGRADMTPIERLVYFADCIEDSRGNPHAPHTSKYRIAQWELYRAELKNNGFDSAFRLVVMSTYAKVAANIPATEINNFTKEAYEFYSK